MKKIVITALLAVAFTGVNAQEVEKEKSPLTFSGYIETYSSYDFNEPNNHVRPGFFYSHNKHNELNLNLGFVKANYAKDNIRGNFALMAGTYAEYNLAAEQDLLKNVFEANVGVKISKTSNLWVDAGIMPSHIGFESAIGKDCQTLTRSILADNSPYYQSGAKISYTSNNEKWFVSGLILNGWQRIQRVNGNNTPALGHQLTYKPNSKVTLNSSSFIGSDTPDSTRQMRYFHNFYGQFQLHKKFGLILGFDIGAQQKSKGNNDYYTWHTPVLIAKYAATDKVSIAARGEYYSDANGVIIATGTLNEFQTYGYSVNLDYLARKNVMWRIEGRSFTSQDKIFTLKDKPSNNNYFITTSLAISF